MVKDNNEKKDRYCKTLNVRNRGSKILGFTVQQKRTYFQKNFSFNINKRVSKRKTKSGDGKVLLY